MRGRAVEVEVVFFDIFPVVALAVRQAEHALFEDGIPAIPQGYAETQQLLTVADTSNAVLAPAIGARSGLVMCEVVPGIAISTVVLPHRAPLPLAQIGSPLSPRDVQVPRIS